MTLNPDALEQRIEKLPENTLLVAHISAPQGLKGAFKLFSHTDPRDKVLSYSPWYVTHLGKCYRETRHSGKKSGKSIVAHLPSINSRNDIEPWIGAKIYIEEQQLEKLDENEFYWRELIGSQVFTKAGLPLGNVERLMETGANDVLIVAGDKERLIPYIPDDVIISVDTTAKKIIVDWDADF